MKHTDYIYKDHWFAWYPVRTRDVGWVWWKRVWRTIDDRPEIYQGLLPIIFYHLNK